MASSGEPLAAPAPSQANTPWWADKSFLLTVAGVIATLATVTLRVQVDAVAIAGVLGAAAQIVAFIVGNKWKSGSITVAEIKAQNAIDVAETVKGATPEVAARALGGLVTPQPRPSFTPPTVRP